VLKEFKDFAMRGNVVDMAVGIIIGAAFGKIISSFVKDIITPFISLFTGGLDFTNTFIDLSGAGQTTMKTAQEAGAPTVNIGLSASTLLDFVIVAFAILMVVKQMNRMKKKEEAAPAAPAEPPKQEVLLEEIRDLLKSKQ
jgi:large conductance mechanosensitive channel